MNETHPPAYLQDLIPALADVLSVYIYIYLGLNPVDVLEDVIHLCMDLTTQLRNCI